MSSMFSNNDPDQLEFMGLKKGGGGEIRKIRLVDSDGTRFSLDQLREEIKTALKERKEQLEKVFNFGAGLLSGRDEAFGFMVGWLTSRILSAYETSAKTEISIEVDNEELDKSQVIDATIEEVEAFLEYLKEQKDNPDLQISDIIKSPIKGDLDGTEEYE